MSKNISVSEQILNLLAQAMDDNTGMTRQRELLAEVRRLQYDRPAFKVVFDQSGVMV